MITVVGGETANRGCAEVGLDRNLMPGIIWLVSDVMEDLRLSLDVV